MKKPIYKRWWFWTIIAVIVLFSACGSMGDTIVEDTSNQTEKEHPTTDVTTEVTEDTIPEVTPDITEEDTSANDEESDTESVPNETTPVWEYDGTVYEGTYASVYITKPRWMDETNGFEPGWYVGVNCYNQSNKTLSYIIDDKSTNNSYDLWEDVARASDYSFKLCISKEENMPNSITIQLHIFITDVADYSMGLIYDQDNITIDFVEPTD